MKQFFLHIRSAIWDPAFYKTVSEKSLKSVIGYSAKLSVFLALVMVLWVLVSLLPRMRTIGDSALTAVIEAYPGSAVFEMKDNVLLSRPAVPHKILPVDDTTKAELLRQGYQFAVVIDTTRASSSPEMFDVYKSPVVFTKSSLVFRKNDGGVEIIPFSDIPNFTVTRATVENYGLVLENALKKVTPIFLILAFVVFYAYFFLGTLFSMLILALFVWLLLYIMGEKNTSYGASYKIGLYAITATLCVEIIGKYIGMPSVPFLGTVILLFVVYSNRKEHTLA